MTATTVRYRWTADENTALVADFDNTEARSPERKAAMQAWVEKTGTSFDSVIARVYAEKAKAGTSPGKPHTTPRTRTASNPAETIARMEEKRESYIARAKENGEKAKAMTVKIREAKKVATTRQKLAEKAAADKLAKAQAAFEKAQANLATLNA